MKPEQHGDFVSVAMDGVKKDRDLLWLQEWPFLCRHLRQADGYGSSGLRLDGGADQSPGVFHGLRTAFPGFPVDGPLEVGVGEGFQGAGHDPLEAVVLDDPVASDGGGGEYGGAGGNVIVDGLPYGFGAGRSPGRLDHAGLDGHGLRDGGFLCGAGDGDVLPPARTRHVQAPEGSFLAVGVFMLASPAAWTLRG